MHQLNFTGCVYVYTGLYLDLSQCTSEFITVSYVSRPDFRFAFSAFRHGKSLTGSGQILHARMYPNFDAYSGQLEVGECAPPS